MAQLANFVRRTMLQKKETFEKAMFFFVLNQVEGKKSVENHELLVLHHQKEGTKKL